MPFCCFVGLGLGEPRAATQAQPPTEFALNEATLSQLQSWMQSGRYTSRQLVDLYLDRIERLDRSGPALNSIIEINPEARAIADALDASASEKGPRGPLHGIPIVIKDNIDTADRMMTTAGSLALEGSIAPRDAFVVERLRAAGAVILAKTNLSEWANFRSTKSTSGWSGRGGQTRNPYVLDRNPCGSSSGTGTAVAANLAAIGVGTETDGSIVCPASVSGLVGIKPTSRPRQPQRHHPDRAVAGHGRADGAYRGGRRGAARRAGRCRPPRSVDGEAAAQPEGSRRRRSMRAR